MENLIIKEITENSAVFYNESQTISGDLFATSYENYNNIILDDNSEAITDKQEDFLHSYYFSNYH